MTLAWPPAASPHVRHLPPSQALCVLGGSLLLLPPDPPLVPLWRGSSAPGGLVCPGSPRPCPAGLTGPGSAQRLTLTGSWGCDVGVGDLPCLPEWCAAELVPMLQTWPLITFAPRSQPTPVQPPAVADLPPPCCPLAVWPLLVLLAGVLSPTVPPGLAAPDPPVSPRRRASLSTMSTAPPAPARLASGVPEPPQDTFLTTQSASLLRPCVTAWHSHCDGDGASLPILADMLSKEPPWCDGSTCYECAAKFGVTTRKHHW